MGFDPTYEEGLRVFGVTILIIGICLLCQFGLEDSPSLIYFYLGWCGYVAVWSLLYGRRLRRRVAAEVKTLESSHSGGMVIKRDEINHE